METPRFGVILKVNDLDVCRRFYRELLDFGEPEVDSPFAVEFRLGESFSLKLERSAATYLEHASAATGWYFETADLEALRRRLEDFDYALEAQPQERPGGRCFRGVDPEGNYFYVAERV